MTERRRLLALGAQPAIVRRRAVGERHGQRVVLGDHVRLGDDGRGVQPVAPIVGERRAAGAEQVERIYQPGRVGAGVVGAPGEPVRHKRTGQRGQIDKRRRQRAHVPEGFLFQVVVLVFDLGHLLGDARDLRDAVRDLDALIGDDGHALRERGHVGDSENGVSRGGPQ